MVSRELREPRVLLADDDPSIRQLVGTILRREGLLIDCVDDGAAAIEKLVEQAYSVILLDLMMPRADGFAVIEHLKQNPRPIKPIVLVITSYADQTFRSVDPAVVSGIVRKPFEIYEIGSIVRMCVLGVEPHFLREETAQPLETEQPN